jgi:hypothetical protein
MTEPAATTPAPPIVCNMTDAPDTATERIAEYGQLFTDSFVGKERTDTGIRFRLRADDGVEDHVRDLAAREKACCAFYNFEITTRDGEVHWDWSVIDDDIARQLLDEAYQLPETVGDGVAALQERYARQGLIVVVDDDGTLRPATPAELGFTE